MSLSQIKKSRGIYQKRYRERNLDKDRRRCRRKQWKLRGMDVDKAERLFDSAKECSICGQTRGRLEVDHDHKTGRIRGILCKPCNLGLGKFEDNPVFLLQAAGYVMNDQEGK